MERSRLRMVNESKLHSFLPINKLCIKKKKQKAKKNLIVLWKRALFIINGISFHSILWCPQQDYENNNLISKSFQFQQGYFVELEINDQKKTSQN